MTGRFFASILQQGDIRAGVVADFLRLVLVAAAEADHDVVARLRHVVVRQDQAVRADDHPGAQRLGFALPGRRPAAAVVLASRPRLSGMPKNRRSIGFPASGSAAP